MKPQGRKTPRIRRGSGVFLPSDCTDEISSHETSLLTIRSAMTPVSPLPKCRRGGGARIRKIRDNRCARICGPGTCWRGTGRTGAGGFTGATGASGVSEAWRNWLSCEEAVSFLLLPRCWDAERSWKDARSSRMPLTPLRIEGMSRRCRTWGGLRHRSRRGWRSPAPRQPPQ